MQPYYQQPPMQQQQQHQQPQQRRQPFPGQHPTMQVAQHTAAASMQYQQRGNNSNQQTWVNSCTLFPFPFTSLLIRSIFSWSHRASSFVLRHQQPTTHESAHVRDLPTQDT